ncbi:MAG: TetR/AcrR family transcriptional regulator [Bacteroidia bacterium]|nr:TetR/AcrR family transcriptional regulator [Bacteroidia bacterium]
MKTKELILDRARILFNERGSGDITVRDLAHAAGISPGNLGYHFPTLDAVTEALYYRLVAALDAQVASAAALPAVELSPLRAYAYARESFAVLYAYRFLMLDFVRIMRRLPGVRAHFRELMERRRVQFTGLLDVLAAGGWLEPPRYPGQYEDWVAQAGLIGDFWIASAEILTDGGEAERIAQYSRLFLATLAPLLTERGLAEIRPLLAGG